MKRKFIVPICFTLVVLSLTACQADDINSAIEGAAGKVGVEVDVKITQDQIDSANDKVKKSADTVKDVLTDEEVKSAAGKLLDSVSDAVKDKK